jgi:hypothetical protein
MIYKEFGQARKGEFANVFVCPPGWDYAFVTDDAYFRDELYDPITVKRQTWKLVEEVEVTFHPVHELCDECHGEGVVLVPMATMAEPDAILEVECPACDGTGDHPHAGQTEITAIP